MNVKNFIVGGIVGGIVDFLLGWLLWGILLKDYFGSTGQENMTMIFLGCMSFGFLISYIFNRWTQINALVGGATSGAILGLLVGLMSNFFAHSMESEPNFQHLMVDTLLMVICGAGVGAAIGLINGKMK